MDGFDGSCAAGHSSSCLSFFMVCSDRCTSTWFDGREEEEEDGTDDGKYVVR